MVSTIHEKVDDDVHGRLKEWKESRGETWEEFLGFLAHDVREDHAERYDVDFGGSDD